MIAAARLRFIDAQWRAYGVCGRESTAAGTPSRRRHGATCGGKTICGSAGRSCCGSRPGHQAPAGIGRRSAPQGALRRAAGAMSCRSWMNFVPLATQIIRDRGEFRESRRGRRGCGYGRRPRRRRARRATSPSPRSTRSGRRVRHRTRLSAAAARARWRPPWRRRSRRGPPRSAAMNVDRGGELLGGTTREFWSTKVGMAPSKRAARRSGARFGHRPPHQIGMRGRCTGAGHHPHRLLPGPTPDTTTGSAVQSASRSARRGVEGGATGPEVGGLAECGVLAVHRADRGRKGEPPAGEDVQTRPPPGRRPAPAAVAGHA